MLFPICPGTNRSVPVAQMLSQYHDANYIRYWLTSWFADTKKPDEVIIDASEALISASVQAFAHCASTNKYVSACMTALIENVPPPPCFIRIDRSHFVRSINGNKHLRKMDERVRRLIKGVIGYLIQCDSLDMVRLTLTHVFTLTRNAHVTDAVSAAKQFLTKLVKTHTIFENFADNKNEEFADQNVELSIGQDSGTDTYRDTTAYKWLQAIYNSVSIQEPSDCDSLSVENIYFSTKLDNFLMQLFVRISMWSNVMCKACGSTNLNPSSSASESEFKNIKRLLGQM